jgi:uncharacterized LabA/DUF88 family protein
MKTYVYIDGFNLYYGAVRGTPFKWLDIKRLCALLLPKHQITRIKYFTARVSARPGDPDQPARQQAFLRALATLPDFDIIYGHFLTNETYMLQAGLPPGAPPKYVKVIKTEEKGSDVNLATHLLRDGFRKEYQAAVLVTNDSDLLEPVRIVRKELGLVVGVLNPHKKASRVLSREASFVKQIRSAALKASQFPATLTDAHGTITKPASW